MKIWENEYKELVSSFLNFWEGLGFSVVEPSPIVNKNWKHTLFVNSGLIKYLIEINRSGKLNNPMTVVQPCIKFGTSYYSFKEMMAKDGYFTSFSQLSCGANGDVHLGKFAQGIVEYLGNTLGDLWGKIVFGVSEHNPQLYDILLESGVETGNIIFPDNGAYALNIPEVIQGRYNSFYFDRGEKHPLACRETTCSINCNCGRYLEIGDIGLICYQGIDFFDHGIGMERLLSLKQGMTCVVDIPEFRGLFDIIKGYLDLGSEITNFLADNFRTVFLLLSCGIVPGNKNQYYSTRFLLRSILWALHKNDKLPFLDRKEMLNEMLEHSAEYISLDKKKKELIVSEILKEKKAFERILKNGQRIAGRLKKAGRIQLPEAELRDIYETYGVPTQVMESLLEQ